MIDKLDLRFTKDFHIDELTKRATESGLKWKVGWLKSNSKNGGIYCLHIFNDEGHEVYFRIKFFTVSNFLITNPSNFGSISIFITFLLKFLTLFDIEEAKICRIDFYVEIDIPLQEVLQLIRILYKQISSAYQARAGRVTGRTVGQGDSQISIYDKDFERFRKRKIRHHNGSGTRIEVRLKGKQRPVNHLFEIPILLEPNENGQRFSPFKNLRLNQITFYSINDFKEKSDVIRHTQLKTLVTHIGYDETRKRLNQNKNFKRDYGLYFEETPLPINLDELLHESLKSYIGNFKGYSTVRGNRDE